MLTRYPGAKSGAGVYQAIINEMPPHRVYVEAFLGSGAILLRKKPADVSIAIDADAEVTRSWSTIAASGGVAGLTIEHGDCRSLIAALGERIQPDWLIYADPPYVRSTRRSRGPIYRHEFTDEDHRQLLSLLLTLKASVMVSGYRCALYDEMLAGWRRVDFKAMTRAGLAIESLWCNFQTPARHEYTYLGANYRERERIKRKQQRWRRRIAAMPELEREAMLEILLEHRRADRCQPAPIAGADDGARAGIARSGTVRSGDKVLTDARSDGGQRSPAPAIRARAGEGRRV